MNGDKATNNQKALPTSVFFKFKPIFSVLDYAHGCAVFLIEFADNRVSHKCLLGVHLSMHKNVPFQSSFFIQLLILFLKSHHASDASHYRRCMLDVQSWLSFADAKLLTYPGHRHDHSCTCRYIRAMQ
jgi:hypothetical protein